MAVGGAIDLRRSIGRPFINSRPLEIAPKPGTASRRLRLRYAGSCVACGSALAKGVEALYDSGTRAARCVVCPVGADASKQLEIAYGVAGASAQREFERRRGLRETRVKARLGNTLGGVVLALTDEPQTTRAWERGAAGERKLGEALAGMVGVRTLHDRRVPGTRGNIDHLLVGPAGVFVVDAKRYAGLIEVRDRGGFLSSDLRLFVGHRDCSSLAANMAWQIDAVRRVIEPLEIEPTPPIVPVLCFVDGEWPLLFPPSSFNGVRLEGKGSIRKLVAKQALLDAAAIERLAGVLARAFPTK